MTSAYPLQWPEQWRRTPGRAREMSRYRQLSIPVTVDQLLTELERMDAVSVVISTNLPLRRDGLPSANAPEPEDPGVAVYWTKDGTPHVIACDKWLMVVENLRAVFMAVAALRQLERCGASEIMSRAFQGFAELPPSSAVQASRTWRQVMELDGNVTAESLRQRYKQLLFKCHPDRGGSHEAMAELNAAYAQALAELGEA